MAGFSAQPIIASWSWWTWNGRCWVYQHPSLPSVTVTHGPSPCPPHVWASVVGTVWGAYRTPALWWQFCAPYTLVPNPSVAGWDVAVRSHHVATVIPDRSAHRIRLVAPALVRDEVSPPPDLVWTAWMLGTHPTLSGSHLSVVGIPHGFVTTLLTLVATEDRSAGIPPSIASWTIDIAATHTDPPIWEQTGAAIVPWFWSWLTLYPPHAA